MLNIGPGEVMVILVIALVVLGPSRLPATARTLGRFLAKTRDVIGRFQQEMQAAADAPLEAIAREKGRLSQPIQSASRTTTAITDQSDSPSETAQSDNALEADHTTSADVAEPDVAEPTAGPSGAATAPESDSESEQRPAQ